MEFKVAMMWKRFAKRFNLPEDLNGDDSEFRKGDF
jgi:hypothetical protein